MAEYKYIFKVAILGDASVGKTTLTYRFITGDFLQNLKSSIGTTLYSKLVRYKGDPIKLQIWDFAGEKRFRFLLLGYIEGANGAFLMYGDIKISLSKQNEFMVLSVKDSGVGLTRSERNKIFKKFGKIERYGKGLDIIPEGVGLGLFISKEIVENHGGKIFVESKGRNKGANFIVKLPIK